jgi:hypothetical protein
MGATALLASWVLLACAGVAHRSVHASDVHAGGGVVARVGGEAITLAALEHWMWVLAPGHLVPDPPDYARCVARERGLARSVTPAGLRVTCEEQYVSLRKRTLSFLIAAAWVVGESRERGLDPLAGGAAANRTSGVAFSSTAGPQDARLLSRLERDIARLRADVASHRPKITAGQLARFYERSRQSFERSEKASFNIVEQLKSPGAARRLMHTLQSSGRRIDWLIAHNRPGAPVAIHEVRDRPTHLADQPAVWRAIFSGRTHVLQGPLPLFQWYSILEVERIIPARRPSLADLRRVLTARLNKQQDRRALDAFVAGWQERWRAQTLCDPRYAVEECRSQSSSSVSEDPFATHVIEEGIRRAYHPY